MTQKQNFVSNPSLNLKIKEQKFLKPIKIHPVIYAIKCVMILQKFLFVKDMMITE